MPLKALRSEIDTTRIRPEQLYQHKKPEDAWIVIRGNVYNVTEYLAFHPGGRDNMLRGVACEDATDLFNEVHPWVNYDKILTKSYIGRLASDFSETSDSGIVRFDTSEIPSDKPSIKADAIDIAQHIVREIDRHVSFNWVQEHDVLLLIFDTGRYGNPFFEIRKQCEQQWTFVITFLELVFVYKFTPMNALKRPPRLKVFYDSGSVEIGFEKVTKELWNTCGEMVYHTRKYIAPTYSKKYVIKEHVLLNKNTFMMVLQKKDLSISNAPLGSYIMLYNDVNELREYTPIPYYFVSGSQHEIKESYNNPLFTFLIRRYTDGRLSNFLFTKKVGDTILGSEPAGSFDLQLIEEKDMFMFLAGGVGVAPYLNIIQFLLEKTDLPVKKIMLVMFNKTIEHQFLLDKFQVLCGDSRFTFECVLTNPTPEYTGLHGYITNDLMLELVQKQFSLDELSDIFFFACGPNSFMNSCNEVFIDFDIDMENTFFFQPMIDHVRESVINLHDREQDPYRLNLSLSLDMTEMDGKTWRKSTASSFKRVSRLSESQSHTSRKLKYCQIL